MSSTEQNAPRPQGPTIEVTKDGPYRVTAGTPISRQTIVADAEGGSVDWAEGERLGADRSGDLYLCRCGQSGSKPFCDGTHKKVGFVGTETASHTPYEGAGEQDGPIVILTDKQELCAFARFCDVGGQVWNLVEDPQPQAAALAVRESQMCPSGRLIAWDPRTRQPLEPELEPSVGIVEDPVEGVAGPIWVRGGIPVVGSDGRAYDVRNRQTLCRCGASRNKPFCDGTHAAIGFTDR